MASDKQKTKKKSPSSIKGAMLAILFVALALLVVILFCGYRNEQKILSNEERIEELKGSISEEEERTSEIEDLEEYMQSDEYLEQTAKEKLGFAKDGEIIFREND